MKIDSRVLFVVDRLNTAGYDAYLVGGCVRDQILGVEPKDWDIATSALPAEMLTTFTDKRIIETGLKHGTVTVVSDNLPVEVTTFRIEGEYKDNRRPESVTFVRNLREDLARRDFTINAIAYHPGKGLIDPFGGVADLNNHFLRCVGNPHDRFQEDGLRILRALRFASVLDLEIDRLLANNIHHDRELLKNISSERIAAELTKLLCGENVYKILVEYPDVFSIFIPEIADMVGFDQRNPYHLYDVWTHTAFTVAAAPKDPALRLAMLFHDTGKPSCFSQGDDQIGHFYGHECKSEEITKTRLRELKIDNGTICAVCELIRWHDITLTEKNLIKWLSKLGETRLRQLLIVKAADAESHSPDNAAEKLAQLHDSEIQLNDILEKGKCFSLSDLALNGNDLIKAGIPEGPVIGEILNRLLEAVMDGRLQNEKQDLLRAAISEKQNCGFLSMTLLLPSSLELAKEFYYSMRCSHFHMSREYPDRYSEYLSLEIPKETESLWKAEWFDKLYHELMQQENRKSIWRLHSQMESVIDSINTDDAYEKMLEATRHALNVAPKGDRILVAETINGRSPHKYRNGLIYRSFDTGRREYAIEFARLSLLLAESCTSPNSLKTNYKSLDRIKRAISDCKSIQQELGLCD